METEERRVILSIRHATFQYESVSESAAEEEPAVRDVSLDIMEGEFLAVIGHNGSGKSTLAKMMNALVLPQTGEVVVGGMRTNDESKIWDIRQMAGMVFQNPDNQMVATIVEEDVAFGPENIGIPQPEIRRRVDEALRSVHMLEMAHNAPHMLSGGQKQRVAIAGILAIRPRIIVLDEPTAMLDPEGRAEVMDTVRRINREEGITIVHITHFMEEAVKADRVIVMEEGRIVMQGTPKAVFSHVAQLQEIGLDVPRAAELAQYLRQGGLPVPEDIIDGEGMVMWLCQSR